MSATTENPKRSVDQRLADAWKLTLSDLAKVENSHLQRRLEDYGFPGYSDDTIDIDFAHRFINALKADHSRFYPLFRELCESEIGTLKNLNDVLFDMANLTVATILKLNEDDRVITEVMFGDDDLEPGELGITLRAFTNASVETRRFSLGVRLKPNENEFDELGNLYIDDDFYIDADVEKAFWIFSGKLADALEYTEETNFENLYGDIQKARVKRQQKYQQQLDTAQKDLKRFLRRENARFSYQRRDSRHRIPIVYSQAPKSEELLSRIRKEYKHLPVYYCDTAKGHSVLLAGVEIVEFVEFLRDLLSLIQEARAKAEEHERTEKRKAVLSRAMGKAEDVIGEAEKGIKLWDRAKPVLKRLPFLARWISGSP